MTRRMLALLLVTALGLVLVARADNPVNLKVVPKAGADVKDDLKVDEKAVIEEAAIKQERMSRQFREFEGALLRLAQRLETSSKAEDREKAVILKKAIEKAMAEGVDTKFDRLVSILRTSKTVTPDYLQKAIDQNHELAADIRTILNILLTDNREEELRRERERVELLLKRLNEIIRQQQIVRAWTERNGMEKERLGREQNTVSKATKDLARALAKGNDKSGNENKGELKSEGKKGSKGKGEAKEDTKESKADTKVREPAPKKESDKEAKGDAKDGQNADKEAKGDAKDGESKETKGGAKKSDERENKGGAKSGDPKENKGGSKEARPKEGKPGEGKPGDPKENKGGSKDTKPSNGKPGQPKESKPGDGKPGDPKGKGDGKGDSKGQSKSGQPKQSPQGQSKSGQKSGQQSGQSKGDQQLQQQPQQPQDKTPGRKQIEDAHKDQQDAEKNIEKEKRPDAAKDQDVAIDKLKQAQKQLEELLRQLREEEIERLLAALQQRCEHMLAMQIEVRDGTVSTQKAIDNNSDKKPSRTEVQRSLQLADREDEIVREASKAIDLLKNEGSAVAFPEVFIQIREDMQDVSRRLRKTDVAVVTQTIEQQIIDTLKDMVEALKKAQKDQQAKKAQPKPPGQSGPAPQNLIDILAELKMIRSLQIRINQRTELYGSEYKGLEQAPVPDPKMPPDQREKLQTVQRELKGLAERQLKIGEVTDNIAKGRNR